MSPSKYSASYIAGGLLYPEHSALRKALLSPEFETLVKREVLANEVLGVKTQASRKRITQEIRKRKMLPLRVFGTSISIA